MNTQTAITTLLDSSVLFEERESLFLSLMDSNASDLDKPLLVYTIIKADSRDAFQRVAIANTPRAPSPEVASLLHHFVDNRPSSSEAYVSLIALSKFEQANTLRILDTWLKSNGNELRRTAISVIQHLPTEVGNRLLLEILNDPASSTDDQRTAAFALSKRGVDAGRQLFWRILEAEETNRYETVTAYCGLAYLKDHEGVSQFVEWLGYFKDGSSDFENEVEMKFRVSMLKQLCGFEHEDEFMDCTAAAIEHLERLL